MYNRTMQNQFTLWNNKQV